MLTFQHKINLWFTHLHFVIFPFGLYSFFSYGVSSDMEDIWPVLKNVF